MAGDQSLDGRRFILESSSGGQVDHDTVFDYRQEGDLVWATYSGGAIRLGFVVGVRQGDELDLRYVHLDDDGVTRSGRCRSDVREESPGILTLVEQWAWESQDGEGESVLRELWTFAADL